MVVAGPRWECVFFMLATVHAGQTQLRPRALQPLSLLSNLPPFHPAIIAVQASWSANGLRFPYGTIAAAQVDGYRSRFDGPLSVLSNRQAQGRLQKLCML